MRQGDIYNVYIYILHLALSGLIPLPSQLVVLSCFHLATKVKRLDT